MNGETCSYERAIVTAVRSGIFTEDLREHLAECSGCREAREAARLLHSAIASDPAGPLPDPRKIYRMATDPRLAPARPSASRSLRLIDRIADLAEPIVAGGLALALVLVVWLMAPAPGTDTEIAGFLAKAGSAVRFGTNLSTIAIASTIGALILSLVTLFSVAGPASR